MATVRFSKDLQDAIVKNAENMFNKQINEARDSKNATWGERIYEIIHRKYILFSEDKSSTRCVCSLLLNQTIYRFFKLLKCAVH